MTERKKYRHSGYKLDYESQFGISHYFKREAASKVLFVTFHGAVTETTELPCFRLPRLKIENQPNLLCFSDLLLHELSDQKVYLGWFLDSVKIKQRKKIKELTERYVEENNIDTIIFHGSSGGGHIALYLATQLNQIALVSNCQFILSEHSQYEELVEGLKANNDELETWSLSEVLKEGPGPKQFVSYSNKDDYTYPHHQHAISVVESLYPGRTVPIYFEGGPIAKEKGVRNHKIGYPEGKHIRDVLNQYLIQKELV